MENVPRMAGIIEAELEEGGALHRFSKLGIKTRVLNLANFGVPQRRMRCIAGNFDFELLEAYKEKTIPLTLGKVIAALGEENVIDPLFGIKIPNFELRDHIEEAPLNDEEVRINRAAKTTHTVYNAMSFPDRLDRPVRTITATCTRVSRESIVVETNEIPKKIRRLTVRERASLQGFPITFQFYADRYSDKLRMVGNAIPPAFTYFLAHALIKTPVESVLSLVDAGKDLKCPSPPAADAAPDRAGSKYSENRRFRFAIPSLQLKSGVRFELVNRIEYSPIAWGVDFYFGTSKSIIALSLNDGLLERAKKLFSSEVLEQLNFAMEDLDSFMQTADITGMQRIWSHRGPGVTAPFMLLDQLDSAGRCLNAVLSAHEFSTQFALGEIIRSEFGDDRALKLPGLAKLARNAPLVVGGIFVGATVNSYLNRANTCFKKARGLAH